MRRLADILNNKPLAFLSIVFAVRDFLLGLAFVFSADFSRTVLATNLNRLGGMWLYGALLAAIAVGTVTSVFVHFPKYTRWFLTASCWFWLFVSMSYAAYGHYIFGAAYFLMCSLPAGYIAFYYRFFPRES